MKFRPRLLRAVFATVTMAALCVLAWECLRLATRYDRHGFMPATPGLVGSFRIAAVLAVLGAYLGSTFLWLPTLFDFLERQTAEVLVAVRQLRSRKSGFLTAISFLAFLGVGLGAFALCMTISVMGGFGNDLKRKILGNNAHVVIDRERGGFTDWRPLLTRIRAAPFVAGATPLVQGEVMVTSQTNLSGVVLRGIDPSGVGQVLNLRRDLIRGRVEYLTDPGRLATVSERERRAVTARGEDEPPGSGSNALLSPPARGDFRDPLDTGFGVRDHTAPPAADVLPGIIVGRELAVNLHLAVGDEVRVVSPFGSLGPLGPIPRTKLFRVAGVFYSGMYEYDTKYAYVTIPVAQRFFNYNDDEITSIEVRLTDIDQSDRAVADILPIATRRHLRVRDWKALNQNLFRALKLERLMIFLLLTVAIIVASFSIVATLLLLVTEKGREIAVLKAMGASDGFIMRVFVSVGALIGVVGALLGVSSAWLACAMIQRWGIPLDPEVYYIERLPVAMAPGDFALVSATAVLICLVAAAFPAWLAGRLRPVDGLRFG